jgi:hypothetical protein
MSNATQHSRQPGDNRRRRSRGGKNRRNNNQNENRRDGERDTRERRGGPSNRSEEFRPQAPRPPRGRPPVKLTWWQKLLKAIGLYKEPAPPARRERKPDEAKPQGEPRAPKSNTRNARSGEAAVERSDERPDDEARPKRGRGGNRTGDRPRGGDPSTVESNRVYVGNLSYDVSEQDLQELFKGVGGVRNVEIVYNRSTHRSKGYGFVEMLHRDDAVRSVEVLNDQHFMGRRMTVSGAKSKGQDERDDQEETPQREPKQVVLAPLPEFPESVEDEAKAETEAPAEAQIETIIETTTESPAAEETAVADAPAEETKAEPEAAELIEKYGFDEPEKKSGDN